MAVDQDIERIGRYSQAYAKSIASTIDRYPSVGEAVPEFLKRLRRIEVHTAADGAVVAYFDGDGDSPTVVKHEIPTTEVVGVVCAGKFEVGSGKPLDLRLAEIEVRKKNDDGSEEIVWRADFEMLQMNSYHGWRQKTEELGRAEGEAEVLSFITAHLLDLKDLKPSKARPVIVDRLDESIRDFERLLDEEPVEEKLQVYLTENPVILHPYHAAFTPKVRLGSEYVTDFVVESEEESYILVEIERSTHKLFTKEGSPTAALRHARAQVEDWQKWIREHIGYAREALPGVSQPRGWVIIGRSRDLGKEGHFALQRTNEGHKEIEIMTYDGLLKRARQHRDRLRDLS